MGMRSAPLIMNGAYSDHYQNKHRSEIEILRTESFYEKGDVGHKIKKLQHETQKRRR